MVDDVSDFFPHLVLLNIFGQFNFLWPKIDDLLVIVLVDGVSLLASLDLHLQLGNVTLLFDNCVQKFVSRSYDNRIFLKCGAFSCCCVGLEFYSLAQNLSSFFLNAPFLRFSIFANRERCFNLLSRTMTAGAERRLASLSHCFLNRLSSAIIVRPQFILVGIRDSITAHLLFSEEVGCFFLVLRSLFVIHFEEFGVFLHLILKYLWLKIFLKDPVLKRKLIGQSSRHQWPQVGFAQLGIFETAGVAHFLQEAAHSFYQILWVIRQLELQSLHDQLLAPFSWGLPEYLFFFLSFCEELWQSVRR